MSFCASPLLLTVLALAPGLPTHAETLHLVDFEIEDQFQNVHRRSDVEGNIVLLIGSDRGGSAFNGPWGKAIQDSLVDHPHYDQISHLAYANMRGLPFFLKGMVRSKFPQEPERWVMMDYKGIIAKTYDFAPKASNILVFSPDGALVHQASGREPDDQKVEQIETVIRQLLDEKIGSVPIP